MLGESAHRVRFAGTEQHGEELERLERAANVVELAVQLGGGRPGDRSSFVRLAGERRARASAWAAVARASGSSSVS